MHDKLLTPADGLPLYVAAGPAEAILASCDGEGTVRPHAPTAQGLEATAAEMKGVDFPREAMSDLLVEANRRFGSPDAAVKNARRIAGASTLVVATGQQPGAFGGPLYGAYKALSAVGLARRAEILLGVPVVPVYWIASEDHDLDEVADAFLPGPVGELSRFRADLSPWRGRPIASVEGAEAWQGPARQWLESVLPAGVDRDAIDFYIPREEESWTGWFARILASTFGAEGLVLLDPGTLQPLVRPFFERALRRWRAIAEDIVASVEERARSEGKPNFAPLEGPPLFLESAGEGRRRRILGKENGFVLRGGEETHTLRRLSTLLAEEAGRFSAHAALRPVIQNGLLPVVAQVLGPGELAYQEELYRFHRSEAGAGRRMPVPWPRFGATLMDRTAEKALVRFRIAAADLALPEEELLRKYTPVGGLSDRVREKTEETRASLGAVREEALALDETLERPFRKAEDAVEKALGKLAGKLQAAEATVKGFAPDKLRRFSAWTLPGGKAQERAFSTLTAPLLGGSSVFRRILDEMDVLDHRHQFVYVDRIRGLNEV
ncbi:MAG: bacillithiol biosynthesis cysteine-adding enzyme BshC [Planctomycetota bacterium]|jgi:bacillithiol biosynthesis cysteine-adding enzyme BshC